MEAAALEGSFPPLKGRTIAAGSAKEDLPFPSAAAMIRPDQSTAATNILQNMAAVYRLPTPVRILRNHAAELKMIFLTFIIIYVTIPFAFKMCPIIVTKIVYFNLLQRPFINFKQPANYLLNHTLNLYLTPEEGITVGVWYTIPDKRWQEASGKDQQWYEAALGDDNPVIVYLHGNGGSRAEGHRVELVKMLSAHGFHVLALDYRVLHQILHEAYMRKYYKFFPGFEWFFMDTITENNIFFHNVENLKSISTPVLILHAEDDDIIPFKLGKKRVCRDHVQILNSDMDNGTVQFCCIHYKSILHLLRLLFSLALNNCVPSFVCSKAEIQKLY
uniref:lysophosphatidylserine lipase ABHD12-like isoform X6 n=1 Tax=Pristiophorus japonicus TaxID=55135 RepID=UPI00398F0827